MFHEAKGVLGASQRPEELAKCVKHIPCWPDSAPPAHRPAGISSNPAPHPRRHA